MFAPETLLLRKIDKSAITLTWPQSIPVCLDDLHGASFVILCCIYTQVLL